MNSYSNSFPIPPAVDGAEPLISLGLPVYNGQNYLRQALDSILAQTYPNWELILSDNGSTDATPEICREYARRDARIRFFREEVNRGATWNFNRVFELGRGSLFRWTAHDDVCEPELLRLCLEAMLANPETVLCHPRTRVIGPYGETLCEYQVRLRTDSPRPSVRFGEMILADHACFQIFGLIRSDAIRRTPLFSSHVGADRNLLAELALLGPFQEIPEFLFLRRDHPQTSTRQFPDAADRTAWFRPAGASGLRYPTLKRAMEYYNSVMRAPLSIRERLACLAILGRWVSQRARSAVGHGTAALRGSTAPERPVDISAVAMPMGKSHP